MAHEAIAIPVKAALGTGGPFALGFSFFKGIPEVEVLGKVPALPCEDIVRRLFRNYSDSFEEGVPKICIFASSITPVREEK
jgi:hypothetical protein